MSRRTVFSIAATLALAPFTAFATDATPSRSVNCNCSTAASMPAANSASSKTSAAPGNSYQGMSQAELERIWAPSP